MSDSPRKASLFVIFLTVFIDLLGFGMVLPLLPIYAERFMQGNPAWMIGWKIGLLMASFSAMQFMFAPMWGRLSDRIGRRPVLMVGLAGSVLFYALFGVATMLESYVLLLVARIGAGIAGATISTAQAYIADSTTLENRAKGMALIGAAFGLGFTFGPLVGCLAVLSAPDVPAPWPGYAASALSAVALLLAWFKLPESLRPGATSAARRWFDVASLRQALATPSVGLLLMALFVCVTAFANFEATLSTLLKGSFQFNLKHISLAFAFIGITLTFAQGFLVRRLSGRVPEGAMATSGAVLEIVGFALVIMSIDQHNLNWLMGSMAVVTIGFALMMPSLNSLISRRSDPEKQGGILGLGQSVSSLARIVGPVMGQRLFHSGPALPYWTAASLMAVGLLLVVVAARGGRDYPAS